MPLKLPKNPPGIRLLNDVEVERLRGEYPPAALPSADQCITCGGTESFRWWSHAASWWKLGDADEVCEFECSCGDQYKLHRYLLHCNIGLSYQRLGWHDVPGDRHGKEIVDEWMADAAAYINAGIGIIFRGPPGTGKTLFGTLVLKELLGRGYDCYFTTFNEMLDKFTSTWRDNDEKKWFYKRVKNAQVLMLDDPGKESGERRGSGMPVAAMDEVLRHRIASSSPTFITTNDSKDKFEQRYGQYIASLLTERNASIVLQGDDFREQSRMRLLDEVKQGLVRPLVIG